MAGDRHGFDEDHDGHNGLDDDADYHADNNGNVMMLNQHCYCC